MNRSTLFFALWLAACHGVAVPPRLHAGRSAERKVSHGGSALAFSEPPAAATEGFALFARGKGPFSVALGPRPVIYTRDTIVEIMLSGARDVLLEPVDLSNSREYETTAEAVDLIVGRWPDQVHAVIADPRPRQAPVLNTHHLEESGWRPGDSIPADYRVARNAHGELALFGAGTPLIQTTERFSVWTTSYGEYTPTNSPGGGTVLRVPTAGAIAPGGALFVAGSNATQSAAVIEWWPADDPQHSSVLTVPGSDVRRIHALAAASPTQLFVAGVRDSREPYLGVFDGKRLTRLKAPSEGTIRGLCVSRSGTLWVVGEDTVWKQETGGFEARNLPRGAEFVCPYEDDDLWMIGADHSSIYRSKRFFSVIDLDKAKPILLANCRRPFLQISKMSAALPATFDFPTTRAALKGHVEFTPVRFVVTADNRWGAIVPNAVLAEELSRLLDNVATHLDLRCENPPVKRTVLFDLATGNPH